MMLERETRMRKKFLLFAMTLVVVCSGCKEEIIKVVVPPVQHPIIGWWEWVETQFMWGIITPERLGRTETYNFRPDSLLEIYRNDTLVQQKAYLILKDSTSVVETLLIEAGGRDDWTALSLYIANKDTLFLDAQIGELELSKYVRATPKCEN